MSTVMPVATLQTTLPTHYSAITADADSALECPSCGSRMTATPNPYYGAGLAQHRTIALCNGCQHIAFLAEAEPEPAMEGVAKRMRALFARR